VFLRRSSGAGVSSFGGRLGIDGERRAGITRDSPARIVRFWIGSQSSVTVPLEPAWREAQASQPLKRRGAMVGSSPVPVSTMEEKLIVFGESGAPWIFMVGCVLAAAILAYGHHLESQIAFDGMLGPLADLYRDAIHHHYGKAALTVVAASVTGAWKSYKRKRRRMLGY
jgi:hypothetical protein